MRILVNVSARSKPRRKCDLCGRRRVTREVLLPEMKFRGTCLLDPPEIEILRQEWCRGCIGALDFAPGGE